MNPLKALDSLLNKVQNAILVLTGTAVMLMILVNAVCRYLRIDWFGSEELTMFVAFWLYFVGAACASREKAHISADMVSLFSDDPKVHSIVGVVKNLIAVVTCVVFTGWFINYINWQLSLKAKSPVYKLPIVIATSPILIAFALWCLYLIRDIVCDIKVISGKAPTNEGGEN